MCVCNMICTYDKMHSYYVTSVCLLRACAAGFVFLVLLESVFGGGYQCVLALARSLSLSLSHTHTHNTHSLSLTHTHTLSLTHSLSLCCIRGSVC